jgi:hypothetical protein
MVFGAPDLNYGDETTREAWSRVIQKMYRSSYGYQTINDEDFVLVEIEKLKRVAASGRQFDVLRSGLRRNGNDAELALEDIRKHGVNLVLISEYAIRKELLTWEIFQQLIQTLTHNLGHIINTDTSSHRAREALKHIANARIVWDIVSKIGLDDLNEAILRSSQHDLRSLETTLSEAIPHYRRLVQRDIIVGERVEELRQVRQAVRRAVARAE